MREVQHNSSEQVRLYLDEALQIVAELDVPDDLRVACFTKAADLIASKQLFIDPADTTAVAMPAMAIPRGAPRH
jgi:hypothetical protein